MWLYLASCCLEWCSTDAELLMREAPLGSLLKESQSLDESTTMGSALGSISASIMEILRMSDTVDLSLGWLKPELDSGTSLLLASPLLVPGGDMGLPKVIFVTVAPCVMMGC